MRACATQGKEGRTGSNTSMSGQVVLVERTGCPPTLCNKVPDLDYQIDLAPAGDFSVPRGD